MRLFHFSDNTDITVFRPRPLRVQVDRPAGQDWLNGSLIWATDEAYELLYLFPRECPRIVFWPVAETTREDKELWMGHATSSSAVACIEKAWLSQFNLGQVFRYELPTECFEPTGEVGMWVCRSDIIPVSLTCFSSLPAELSERNISLRVMDRLTPLKSIWKSTLHASGIRLRNAQDWGQPGWTHSKPGRQVIV